MLSESLEEDFSGFVFLSFFLDGVIVPLEIDRLDDEILESDDSGSSGKPVENYLVVINESSKSESISSSLSVGKLFIMTTEFSIASGLLSLVLETFLKRCFRCCYHIRDRT